MQRHYTEGNSKMIIAILIMSIMTMINTFFIMLILLAIYGKCNDIVESHEDIKGALVEFAKGFASGLATKRK